MPETTTTAATQESATGMVTIDGISGAWNYTIGPALIYEGPATLSKINTAEVPVVVVAKYIPLEHLGRIDFPHVLGFVIEEGGPGDPSLMVYSNQHRATVLRAQGAVAAAKDGETVVVDGVNAKAFFRPGDETIAKYKALRRQGPPPEPPDMIQKLLKVAMDFQNLDAQQIKGNIIDFEGLGRAMLGVMTMYRAEKLPKTDRADIEKFIKGSHVEKSVVANLDRYEKALAQLEAQGKGEKKTAPDGGDEKADPAAARRAAKDAERARGRGAASSEGAAAKPASEPGARSPKPEAGEKHTDEKHADEKAPEDAVAARRAAREAEIAAARAARRGGGEGKK